MSYPTPPGSGNPYGQPPPQGGWQPQWQGAGPVPPQTPAAPPGPPSTHPGPSQYGGYAQPGSPVLGSPTPGAVPPSGGGGAARKVFGGLLTVFGVLGTLGGGALAAHAYSNSQQAIPNSAYGPTLWRNEPTEVLFPETVGEPPNYTHDAADKEVAQWSRMGISEDTSCSKGLSGGTKESAERLGCKAVLRATYVDLTGEMVATVAIIVLPAGTAGQEMGEYFDDQEYADVPDAAVVPFAVPDTLAAKWQDNRRNGMGGTALGGDQLPYAVAVTTGAVNGRTSGNLPGEFGSYGANDQDRKPWMDAGNALSESFFTHLRNLER